MDTLSYKTVSAKNSEVNRDWYIVDADGQTLGRMCTEIASVLRGKNKPSYTPHVDCGDHVIVINADKVHLTGNKWAAKEYVSYSGYPGGLKKTVAKDFQTKHPNRIVEKAVKGMLPKTKLGRAMFKKLHVYTTNEHPHKAQNPKTLKIN